MGGARPRAWGQAGEETAAGQTSAVASSLRPVNVDDIYKRNRPWPSGFGPKEYCRAFRKYADEGHASHYGALLKVQQSLEASNAYTPQVKALMENIRPDADDREVAEGLERVMEAIVETARPYNKVGKLDDSALRESVRSGEASETCSAERQIACDLAVATTRGVDCGLSMDGPAMVAAGRTTGTVAPVARVMGHEPVLQPMLCCLHKLALLQLGKTVIPVRQWLSRHARRLAFRVSCSCLSPVPLARPASRF